MKPQMVGLIELFSDQFRLVDDCSNMHRNHEDDETSFAASCESSAFKDSGILQHPNINAISSMATRNVLKSLDGDLCFSDTDSGLGDSTPPSPTWLDTESSQENYTDFEKSVIITKNIAQCFSYQDDGQNITQGKLQHTYTHNVLSQKEEGKIKSEAFQSMSLHFSCRWDISSL